jgi:Zn-dependent peptidase ImmA (M78 family)
LVNLATATLNTIWQGRGYPIDPVWIANKVGARVYIADLQKGVMGTLIKERGCDPIIALNGRDSNHRRRFTCARLIGRWVRNTELLKQTPLEYEHIVSRNDPLQETKADEAFANAFAADILMPTEEVRRLQKLGYSPAVMAHYFLVCDDAIRYRLWGMRE